MRTHISKRPYSTSSVNNNLSEIDNIDNNKSIKFDSLLLLRSLAKQGCKQIKLKDLGISGVYKLTNKDDSSRFYIGSSNHLALIIRGI